MKKYKIVSPFIVTLCAFTNIVSLSSCNNNSKVSSDIEEFIYDRTFSIMGIGESAQQDGYVSMCFGTCWIVDDSSPNNNNDYKYYVATNWHVMHGNDDVKDQTVQGSFKYKYADASISNRSDNIIDFRRYCDFNSCVKQNQAKFEYDSPKGPNFNPCIDMFIYSVDFGNPTGSIKTKLDNINETKRKNGYINKFVNSDSTQIRNKDKFVGGYPMKESGTTICGGRWEIHKLEKNELSYHKKTDDVDDSYPVHKIGEEDEAYYYYDVSPQYIGDFSKGSKWMTGGSSGSMLVTKDFEICGIYWGGFVDSHSNLYPCFSLFKTTNKDFISDWIN